MERWHGVFTVSLSRRCLCGFFPCGVEVLDHSKEWEVMILWNGKLLNHYWKQ